MADYWISDAEGRVLGPVGLQVLSDLLLAGRITGITRVSTDGTTWHPLEHVPELQRLAAQRAGPDRAEKEKAEAVKLRQRLEAMRTMPAHEIFKVAPDAPLETYREAFFRLSKKFHPDSLPADVHADLRDACFMAFRFFSALMTRVENGLARASPPPLSAAANGHGAAPARTRTPSPIASTEPQNAPPPRYDAEAFVGIKQLGPGLAQARIRVTRANVAMFTDHPMINLAHGGFFLADERVLPLGTIVALTFNFEDPEHTVIAKGKVTWEDAGRGQSPHGFGIKFQELATKDREFIDSYVRKAREPVRAAAR